MTPFGAIVAEPWRGRFMGNRGGRIHDRATRTIVRRQASRQWIYCVLDFKDRRRTVMGAGYTELFFADEASALAAGHRPCFECQRARAKEFAAAAGIARAGAIDAALDADRQAPRRALSAATLPDGAMIAIGDEAFVMDAFAMDHGAMRRWSPSGCGARTAPPATALVLTPAVTLSALRAGFAITND